MHSVARVRPTHPAPASLRRATVAKVARIHAHGRLVLHRVKEMESAGLSEPQASAVVTTVNDIVESSTSDQLGEIIAAVKGLDIKFSTRMDESDKKSSTLKDDSDKKFNTLISAIALLTVALLVSGVFPRSEVLSAILGGVVTGLCAAALLTSIKQGSH